MASAFQRAKIARVFTAMDTDGDGYLTEDDFEALTARWTALRGDVDHAQLTELMMSWWGSLRAAVGVDQVAISDILALVEQLGQVPQAVTATAEAMFDAVDVDGDGRVSPGEYWRLIQAWTGLQSDTSVAFALLDLNADGYLSRSEFADYWTEFWSGDNPDAPGSWIFGLFPAGLGRG